MSIIIYLLNVYYNLSSVKKRRSQEVMTGIYKNRVEETVPGGLIRFREKFIASRLRWESSLKLHQREVRRRDRDSRQDSLTRNTVLSVFSGLSHLSSWCLLVDGVGESVIIWSCYGQLARQSTRSSLDATMTIPAIISDPRRVARPRETHTARPEVNLESRPAGGTIGVPI